MFAPLLPDLTPSLVLRRAQELSLPLPALPPTLPSLYARASHHLHPACPSLPVSEQGPTLLRATLLSDPLCPVCSEDVLRHWEPEYDAARRLVLADLLASRTRELPPSLSILRPLFDASSSLQKNPSTSHLSLAASLYAEYERVRSGVEADAEEEIVHWAATALVTGGRKKAHLPPDLLPLPEVLHQASTNASARIAQRWRGARRISYPLDISSLAATLRLPLSPEVLSSLEDILTTLDERSAALALQRDPEVVLLRRTPDFPSHPLALLSPLRPRQYVVPQVVAAWLEAAGDLAGYRLGILPSDTPEILETMHVLWESSDAVLEDPQEALAAARSLVRSP